MLKFKKESKGEKKFMKFQDLNLTLPTTTNSIIINEQEVAVKTYLPISDKIDLIQIALQKA